MDVRMAQYTQRDQIFLFIITQQAARLNVMNLKICSGTTVLAAPSVTLQH